jgi:hypothetical protein
MQNLITFLIFVVSYIPSDPRLSAVHSDIPVQTAHFQSSFYVENLGGRGHWLPPGGGGEFELIC